MPTTWKEVQDIRNHVLQQVGFDLFADPLFMEHAVCRMLGVVLTDKQSLYDCIVNDMRVEIKHSNLSNGGVYRSLFRGKSFHWQSLNGTTQKGKGADVYVFTGYDLDENRMLFFVIPGEVIGKRAGIKLYKKHLEKGNLWGTYLTDPDQLLKAITSFQFQRGNLTLYQQTHLSL